MTSERSNLEGMLTSDATRAVHSSIGELCSGANGKVQIFFSKLHRATMILEIFFQLENARESRRNILRCV